MTTPDSTLSSFTTITGATAPGTILSSAALTPHDWSADSTGLYHTGTDLAAEWEGYAHTMQTGGAASLNDIQRLEGNAEAVFENTGLAKLSAAAQAVDREDVQREYDAMAAAMRIAGIDETKPLSVQDYLTIGQTIQASPALDELFMQGHGLNNSGSARYAGYTNDFQNNTDNTTRFVGGGALDNGAHAIPDFFDDVALSHIGFSVVAHNGQLIQLNQNGALETPLFTAVAALNDSLYYRVYTSVDFASHGPTAATNKASNAAYWTAEDKARIAQLEATQAAPAPAGFVKTLYGFTISDTMTFDLGGGIVHTWTANSSGLFVTKADLASEWKAAYVDLVTKGGKDLTVEQRVEANAEAIFENTGLAKLSAAQQAIDRQDAQRQFDAEFAAVKLDGINPAAAFTDASYLELSQTLRDNAALNELAIQGHGLNAPPSSAYAGFTSDFQTHVDNTTTYVGPGLEHNQKAVLDVFDDLVLSHAPFAVVVRNGKLVQLNQNGAPETSLARSVDLLNELTHKDAFNAQDFKA